MCKKSTVNSSSRYAKAMESSISKYFRVESAPAPFAHQCDKWRKCVIDAKKCTDSAAVANSSIINDYEFCLNLRISILKK